uniref:Calcium-binding protein n=1 Tax=Caldilinea aerophila TaxID=133453 RepID=A0A7C1JYS3_9CHLR
MLGQNLVLDMGEGEEGTSDLIVYYGPLGAGVVASIQFLDADQQVIYSASLRLSANVGGAQVQVTYPNAPTPYRFVRFTSMLSAYTIDAVQAVTYRPDSDNDGLPDAWEIQYGLDPLDPAGDHGAAGDPDNDGLTNLQEWTAGTHPNNPDTDGDGLPDGWEVQYALDPLDPAGDHGAAGDPDNDGRTNLEEYLTGTNPVEFDGALFLPLVLRE